METQLPALGLNYFFIVVYFSSISWEYIHNSQNFSPEEWDVISNKGKELVNKVWEIVDNGTTTGYANKDTSVRKGKYIGTRRNWIPTK